MGFDMTINLDFQWFAIFVALNTIILLMLGVNISRLRVVNKVANGDGNCRPLMKAIRAHGNGVEHTSIYAMAVLALTLLGLDSLWLAVFVLSFVIARILHAYGMLTSQFLARRIGAGVTFLLQGVSAITILLLL